MKIKASVWPRPVAKADSFSLNISRNYTALALFLLSLSFILFQNSKSLVICNDQNVLQQCPNTVLLYVLAAMRMSKRTRTGNCMKRTWMCMIRMRVAKFLRYNGSDDGIFCSCEKLHVLCTHWAYSGQWLNTVQIKCIAKWEMGTCLHMRFYAI